jgi:diguanylate cyclase (GGDEF)-like protein/PAS domain S-box-containing protein
VPEEARFETELKAAVEALRRSEQQYRVLAEQTIEAVLLLDKEGRLRDVNAAGLTLLGLPRTQVLKKRVQDLLRAEPGRKVVPPRGLPTSPSPVQELRLRRRDGRVIEAEVSGRHLAGGHIQLLVRDLTDRRRAAEALRQSEERYRGLADSAPDAVLVETGGRIVFMNAAGCRLFGASAPLVGRALADFVHPEDRDPVGEMLRAAVTGGRVGARLAGRFLRIDGTPVEVEGAATGISHRGRAALQIVVRERGEESGAPESRDAYRDGLTGLPGLPLLDDRLSVALTQAYRYRHRVGLVFVDLDGFGAVNEAMGRAAGDRLLRATARRLSVCVRKGDSVARLTNDAFALLLPGLRHTEDAGKVAEKVLKALRKPFPLRERAVRLTASVGVSVFPEDGDDAQALLLNAESAMLRARDAGGDNYQRHSGHAAPPALDPLELEVGLRAGLTRGEMSLDGAPAEPGILHYQPFYNLASGRVAGVEALLRWQHPHLGLVFPQEFLSKADFAGLILSIGPWILRTACAQARAWQRLGHRGLRLAVNLSPPEMKQRDLVERVREALAESGLSPRFLQIEVPESYAMLDLERSAETLGRLKALGASIVLDRFGVGYSSLSRLARLPLDALKLDLAFQRGPTAHPDDASLLTAVMAVAKSLKLRVFAQGVEAEAQMTQLRDLRCDEVQGYLLSAPNSAARCEALLASALGAAGPAAEPPPGKGRRDRP